MALLSCFTRGCRDRSDGPALNIEALVQHESLAANECVHVGKERLSGIEFGELDLAFNNQGRAGGAIREAKRV